MRCRGCGEAKSPKGRNLLGDPPKQPGKPGCGRSQPRLGLAGVRVRAGFVPGVDRLPEQGDLPHTPSNQIANLADDLVRGPIALGAPCIGNDTKCAALIAALHDGHVGGDLRAICMRLGPKELRVVHVEHRSGDRWGPLLRLANQRGQLGDVVGPEHDVYKRRLSQQTLAFLLGHATCDCQDRAPPGLLEGSKSP